MWFDLFVVVRGFGSCDCNWFSVFCFLKILNDCEIWLLVVVLICFKVFVVDFIL